MKLKVLRRSSGAGSPSPGTEDVDAALFRAKRLSPTSRAGVREGEDVRG
ncbi:hypothetical protein W911_16440 [Hyphomicrobium nitrativorans NL23]|uniref:Uncharacterized protein n=1 Tax=Hyphomicrobium nitrativorans NL23 TaxID=1029756 RepID=V5SJY2_9HYPH|nr:hypothetical protein W911_16440 [Hyphomicrobium nitrativorans NL23]